LLSRVHCSTCFHSMPLPPPLSFLTIRPPPRSTPFPYTTLFRSSPTAKATQPEKNGTGSGPQVNVFAVHGADPEVQAYAMDSEHRSEEHTSELQSLTNLVCRLLLEKKKEQREPKRQQR